MNKATWRKLFFAMMLVLLLALVACSEDSDGNGNNNGNNDDNADAAENNDDNNGGDGAAFTNPQADEDGMYDVEDFPSAAANTEEGIDGGDLTYAIVSDSPFAGTLNRNFYSGTYDDEILEWIDESLLSIDEDFIFTDDGIASFEYDEDEKTITFEIEEGVKWSDGEELTADDWKLAYEVIAHPGYDGPRYDSTLQNVVGMKEYHDDVEGNEDDGYETIAEYREEHDDTVSGVEVIDDHTLKVTYEEFTPSLLAGGIWTYAMPTHIFEDMPVEDMDSSDEVRKNPVGLGPYKVESIVEGESVVLSPNEHYWRGEPGLDEVTLKVVADANVVQELENGSVDIASFPSDKYPDNDDMSNVQFLGRVDLSYTYIGFKLGTWDKENGEVAPDPDMKMSDHDLREAMWYAVDNDAVGEQFYNGLRWNGNTLIPPSHVNFHADDVEAPTYDPDKANEILDEAGYEWADGEDYRTDKDGEELVINFASMDGGDIAEPLAKYYIQAWEEVGLNVELLDGRLQEFEVFYDRVGETGDDDEEVDIYQGAWGVASDVDPSGLYGPEAIFNFPRYQSDENDELLEEGLSVDSFDLEHRQDVYKEWQELMVEDIPVFPTLYRSGLVAVNKRVSNYDIAYGTDVELYELGVTEEEPAVD
ncbi:MAG TPA: oligopeptide ABC transporter substrate-binding protein [Virgibacillus sp.]|nr:oligopeptide ABC transporter substrate-binding protein [Virgibacillus sp.]